MSAATTIVIAVVTIGSSAALGVAHHRGWGGFGELTQSIAPAHETCEASITAISWSSGVGSQPLAQTRALVSWSKNAHRHGRSYASWHNARNRDITCHTFSDGDAKCIVKGRPCQREAKVDLDRVF